MTEQTPAPGGAGSVLDDPAPAAGPDLAQRPGSRRRRLPQPLVVVSLLAVAVFAGLGIGGPLLGDSVFAGTDEMMTSSPYRDAGLGGAPVQNVLLNDTYDTIIPNTVLFADALRSGQIAGWNPYVLGGATLGATPNFALASPLTLPYYLLPGWLAPAYVKLLEIAVALGGCFLFLRRIGLSRPAALLGGLVFVAGAFLIAWTNWPQTRTAAMIPFVFWAVERLVRSRLARDAALLSVAVAVMVFGGFPAITGYTLLLAGSYLLVRTVAEHGPGRWWRDVRLLATGALGVLGGFALAAVQVLPFMSFLSGSLVQGRGQTPQDHLPHEVLITALAPFALGTADQARPPLFAMPVGLVEGLSYVGAGALVLIVVAVAAPWRARSLLPRGVWAFLVLSVLAGGIVIYAGGRPLAMLQQLPFLFSDNLVGRARSVLGFLVAVLAAVGLDMLLRREVRSARGGWRWVRPAYGAVVWSACAVFGIWVWQQARLVVRSVGADGPARVAFLDRNVLTSLVLLGIALGCAAVLWWLRERPGGPGRGRRPVRFVAAALLPLLIAGQALTLVREYWPRSDRDTFYPVTDGQRYLQAHLGHDRFAFASGAMVDTANVAARLRALNGHTFLNERFAQVLDALPGKQFNVPATYVVLGSGLATATSPVLDRLGTRYFVTSPEQPVLGVPEIAMGDGSSAVLAAGDPVTLAVPGDPARALRAVGLTPVSLPGSPAGLRVQVVLRDPSGQVVARGVRSGHGMAVGQPFLVPVATEGVPGTGPATTVTVRADQDLAVQAGQGAAVVSAVRAAPDGLRLAFAGSSVVYERLSSLARIRWASEAVVEPDARRRPELVAGGQLGADQVLLDAPHPGAPPGPASVRVVEDGFDEIVADVQARGAGYLVVADALQNGWRAEVDGTSAELLPADHGTVAVAVPPGAHQVRLSFSSPQSVAGLWISALTAVALLVIAGAGIGSARARRHPPPGPGGRS